MFTAHMSYADLSIVLNEIAKKPRILSTDEMSCIINSLNNPFLAQMLKEYPLFTGARNILQKTLTHMQQNRVGQRIPTSVHDIAFGSTRERTKRYLEKHFPVTKRYDLMQRLREFVKEALAHPDVQKEIAIAEESRYKSRKAAFQAGELKHCAPIQSTESIIKEIMEQYIPHLQQQYDAKTTFAWDILESLFNRMDTLSTSEDKEAARNTLILALDDARAAYDLLEKKYVDDTDFTCQKGLEERLLDHHQLTTPDIRENLMLTKGTIQALMSPFALLSDPDREHGGIRHHLYTPLLYQLYAEAAGYHFEERTRNIFKIKDTANIRSLKQKYLNQFSNERISESQSKIFDAAIENMAHRALIEGIDNKNPILIFLDKEQALEIIMHTERQMTPPVTERTEEEILDTMVANGPFLDHAHLEAVLAWNDRNASLHTLQDSLAHGLEPSFTEISPSKESMILAYNAYVRYQLNHTHACQFDFTHTILEQKLQSLSKSNTITPELNLFPQLDRPPIVAIQSLYDIPCTQTVLCQWLVTFPLKLSENQKNNLALLCAKQGYAKALSILLSQGVNPNYADLQEEKTLLLMAIANNHAPTVEVLLNAGATMEWKGDREAGLYIASMYNFDEALKMLIKHGVNPHTQSPQGVTYLMCAAHKNSYNTLQVLIDENLNLNLQDQRGYTALMCAAEQGGYESLKILLNAGADINLKNKNEKTALILAATKTESIALIKNLIQAGAQIDSQDKDKLTALMNAAQSNNSAAIEALINAGANLELKNAYGETALHLAAFNATANALEILIAHGANIHLKNHDGETALTIAIESKKTECVKILIKAGAEIENPLALLKLLASTADIELLTLLSKDYMNKIQGIQFSDKTPLMRSAEQGDRFACRALLKNGVNFNHCDKNGYTALDLAIINGHSDIIKELMCYEITPYYLMKSIELSIRNPQYHHIVPLLFEHGIAEIILRYQPNIVSLAKEHGCAAAIFALNREDIASDSAISMRSNFLTHSSSHEKHLESVRPRLQRP